MNYIILYFAINTLLTVIVYFVELNKKDKQYSILSSAIVSIVMETLGIVIFTLVFIDYLLKKLKK